MNFIPLTILNWNVLSKKAKNFKERLKYFLSQCKLLKNILESDESCKEKISEDAEKVNNTISNVNTIDFNKNFIPKIDNKHYF